MSISFDNWAVTEEPQEGIGSGVYWVLVSIGSLRGLM